MTTVIIVDDVRLHRRGYCSLLKGKRGIEILGACNQEDAPEHVRAKQPDVVLLDVTTGGSPTVIKSIRSSSPQAKVIALGVKHDEHSALAWMAQGASHFVTERGGEAELLSAIADVTSNELHCTPAIAHALREQVRELTETKDLLASEARLTPREREIAHLLGQGATNKEIAQALCIEPGTVKIHVHHILAKAHVHCRTKILGHFE